MASSIRPLAHADQRSGYAPEELARVESELASLDVRDLFGRLSTALEELAREREAA